MRQLSFEIRFIDKPRISPRLEIQSSSHYIKKEIDLSSIISIDNLLISKGLTWLQNWRKRITLNMVHNQFYKEISNLEKYEVKIYSYLPYLKFVKWRLSDMLSFMREPEIQLPIWHYDNYTNLFIGPLSRYTNKNRVFMSLFFRNGLFRRISNLIAIITDNKIHYYLNLNIDFTNQILPYTIGASFVDRGVRANEININLQNIGDFWHPFIKADLDPDLAVAEFNFLCNKKIFKKLVVFNQDDILE